MILSICAGNISNVFNFDSNIVISCNAPCFSYFKSVNNLEILDSPSNKRSNNSSLSFSTSSFDLFILFIFSFADKLPFFFQNHVVFQKIYILFMKLLNLHLTFLRYCSFNHSAYLALFLFHFLFHLFLVLSIIQAFLFHLTCFLNLLTHL